MKINKEKSELKELTVPELRERLELLRRTLLSTILNAASQREQDYSQFSKLRKSIARVSTILRQHEIAHH